MHREISPRAAKRYPVAEFTGRVRQGAGAGNGGERGHRRAAPPPSPRAGRRRSVPVSLQTHAFGQISGRLVLPLAGDEIAWSPNLVFPGLGPGERLVRSARVPGAGPDPGARRDPAGRGAGREPLLPARHRRPERRRGGRIAHPRAGPRALRGSDSRRARRPGASGLELAFNRRLAGQPGGELVAVGGDGSDPPGGRVLAEAKAGPGQARSRDHRPRPPAGRRWRRSAALYGGVAVLDARDGSVLALAGIAFSGPSAAGLDVQGDHDHRRPRGGGRSSSRTSSRPRPRSWSAAVRSPTPTTKPVAGASPRPSRSRATASLRRSAPSSARSASSRQAELYGFNSPPGLFHQAALRAVEPAPEHDPRLDPRRPGAGSERDRPGPGAGHAAPDGLGRPDDRRRRHAEPHPDRQRSQAAASRRSRCGSRPRRWRPPFAT